MTSWIRSRRRRDREEIEWLRERVAYLEARLAERAGARPRAELDDALRARIAARTEEILSGGYKRRAEEAKRRMAERLAYHEVLAEEEQERRQRAAS